MHKIEELCFAEEVYNLFVTGVNRGITVSIAVYRFCLVFFPYSFLDPLNKKKLNLSVLTILLGMIIIL